MIQEPQLTVFGQNGPILAYIGLYWLITFDSGRKYWSQNQPRLILVRAFHFWWFWGPKMNENTQKEAKNAQKWLFLTFLTYFWPNLLNNFCWVTSERLKITTWPIWHTLNSFLTVSSNENNHKYVKNGLKISKNRQNHVLRLKLEIKVPIRFRTWYYDFWKLDELG